MSEETTNLIADTKNVEETVTSTSDATNVEETTNLIADTKDIDETVNSTLDTTNTEETINLTPNTKNITEHFRVGNIPLNEENILLVEIDAHDRKTVRAWMDYSENIRQNWSDVTKPLFILIDMTTSDFSFGAYANKRAADMMKIQPEIPTYIAWVIRKNLIGDLLQATLRAYNASNSTARFMIIYSREDGYAWLDKAYQKDVKKNLT